jgi:polyhydroxyalkanoate synthesis regulator phasin
MIFLDEAFAAPQQNSAEVALAKRSKALGLNEKMFERFAYDAGGMEICFEAEVAWNEMNRIAQVGEFKALQEGAMSTIWETIKKWAKAVKDFFVKMWNAVVAWFKKILGKFRKPEDIIAELEKLSSYTGDIKVKRKIYAENKYILNAVNLTEKYIDDAAKKAQFVLNKADDTSTQYVKDDIEKIKKAKEDLEETLNKNLEDYSKEEAKETEISADGLKAKFIELEKRIIAVQKVKDELAKLAKTGSDWANRALKAAEDASKNAAIDSKYDKEDAVKSNAATAANHAITACKDVVSMTKMAFSKALSMAQKEVSRATTNFNEYKSAGSEIIYEARKKEREAKKKD